MFTSAQLVVWPTDIFSTGQQGSQHKGKTTSVEVSTTSQVGEAQDDAFNGAGVFRDMQHPKTLQLLRSLI